MTDASESDSARPARPPGPPPSAREATPVPPPARAETGAARPTPVREALERESPPVPAVPPGPERDFPDAEGQLWTVRLLGRTRSGTGSDKGASLALLGFLPAREEGTDEDGGSHELETLAVVDELDRLSDHELTLLLARALPPPPPPGDFFPGTRRGRGGEGAGRSR